MRRSFVLFSSRSRALLISVALVLSSCTGVLTLAAAAPAAAATAAAAPTLPATVSADPLPTVQQNGVVWSEVTVGNTVYATGSFSQTWPAGTANTTANDTARGNLLAFNITTGNLISTFNHSLNAQGLVVTASPDGSVIYVGGDFTTVDGVTRNHIAAFSASTGALLSTFAPSISGEVEAISATNSTVYVGGNFSSAMGVTRTKLAAFTAGNGALLSWAPTADNGQVQALVVTPDQSEVVIGGRFPTLNGVNAYGLGAVDATTGATLPYAANQYIRDYTTVGSTNGNGAGITSLTTDGNQIYGSGFSFNEGNFEGTFALSPDTGAINFVNDCHGDTYDVQPVGQVLYDVSHEHDCSAVGDFPDTTSPRVWHHATAWTTYATGTNTGPDSYGWNYNGVPDSTLLPWYPTLALGTVTGQSQAAWSVTGNSSYLALGGEFPSANGVAQAGLVRYAIRSLAPNKVGPQSSKTLTPSVVSLSSGSVRVAWQATWDQDDPTLTYNVLRDGSSTPIYTTTQTSNFWQLPAMGFTDTGLTPGSTHTYRVQVVDPWGNKLSSSTVSATVSSSPPSAYVGDVLSDGASNLWRFNEGSGSTAYDWAGFSDMTEGSGVTDGAPGPLSDSATAATFNGTSTGTATSTSAIPGPNTFSIEAWFKTTSTSGGKIVGFGDASAGNLSGNYDRHIYMTNSGQLVFGVYNHAAYTITTPGSYNDGSWHQVVGELSASGMALYVDGRPIGQNTGTTVGQSFSGYWKIGGDNLAGWPSQPSSNYFNGSIGDAAIYPTALTTVQVARHYTDSGRTSSIAPAPTDSYGAAVYNDNPELYWRLDDAGGSTAVDTSPYQDNGTYSGGISYLTPSPVTGSNGTGVTLDGNSGIVTSSQTFTNPTTYSEELWFKTTTTSGGRLIGFGDQPTGSSGNYDRMVWMLNSGQLEFGAYNGNQNTVTSSHSYNDGSWHYLVATQGSHGMNLYVDGQSVGTNPDTQSQNYTGYWRIGGDNTWGGNSSNYFAGSIDEAAVYASELTAAQVQTHYVASPAAVTPPPVANFTPTCQGSSCSFDASGSTDQMGTITSYAWNFGDGQTGSGKTVSHVFAAGQYSVQLAVTDSFGKTSTSTQSVTVAGPTAPTASFATPNCTGLTCTFDASGSSDPSGTITSYNWSFSGGGTASGVKPTYTFGSSGTVSATLTVTDSGDGLTGTSTQSFGVSGPMPPSAAFTSSCTNLTCTFDASGSTDPSGTISGYSWTFPNGDTASGRTTSYTFAAAGAQQVTLVVSDSVTGLSNSVTNTANPKAPPSPPTAAFTSNCTALRCAFDASSSTDTSGTITGYSWSFGDGTNASGPTSSDTYQTAGDYTVTLTVTDSNNLTAQVSHVVSPRPAANPSIPLYGSDSFNRTVASGWGTADTGGAWSPTGSAANMSVSNGVASLIMPKPTNGPGAYLPSVSTTDSTTFATVSTTAAPAGGPIYLDVLGRRIASNADYRGRVNLLANGSVSIGALAVNGSTQTAVGKAYTLPGVTYTAGMQFNVELQVTGTSPTTVKLKVWPTTATQPTSWQVNATDSTSVLQAAGSVGVVSYLAGSSTVSPVTMLVSSFSSGPSVGLPSAAFTPKCSGLSCSVDGTASTDPSGTISSYQWSWGDGVVTTGPTSTHAFAAGGTYRITLTATDPSGWTSVVTRTVTLPA